SVPELEKDQAYKLIQQQQRFGDLLPDEIDQIYAVVGGNPLGILLCQINKLEMASISDDNLTTFVSSVFETLSDSTRTALYTCILCPLREIDLQIVLLLWGSKVSLHEIANLTHLNLLTEVKTQSSTYY